MEDQRYGEISFQRMDDQMHCVCIYVSDSSESPDEEFNMQCIMQCGNLNGHMLYSTVGTTPHQYQPVGMRCVRVCTNAIIPPIQCDIRTQKLSTINCRSSVSPRRTYHLSLTQTHTHTQRRNNCFRISFSPQEKCHLILYRNVRKHLVYNI